MAVLLKLSVPDWEYEDEYVKDTEGVTVLVRVAEMVREALSVAVTLIDAVGDVDVVADEVKVELEDKLVDGVEDILNDLLRVAVALLLMVRDTDSILEYVTVLLNDCDKLNVALREEERVLISDLVTVVVELGLTVVEEEIEREWECDTVHDTLRDGL